MASKEQKLKGGLNALLGGAATVQAPSADAPAPVKDVAAPRPSRKRNTDYQTACVVVNKEKMAKIRAIAEREELSIKEVLEAAMTKAIEAYEKRHGVISLHRQSGRRAEELFD